MVYYFWNQNEKLNAEHCGEKRGVGFMLRIMWTLPLKEILGDTGEKLFFQPWEIPRILLENTLLFQDFMIHYQAFFHVSVSGYPQWYTIDGAIANGSESPGKRPAQP